VTYVAESGGAGTLPGIEIRWFDLDTGTVETARAEAVEIAIDGPPAALSDPEGRRRIAVLAIAGVLLAAILGLALRLAVPPARRRLAERREARLGSEGHAWRALEKALSRRDHAALYPALDTWAARVAGPDPRRDSEVQRALASLGRARYGVGNGAGSDPTNDWDRLGTALRTARVRTGQPPAHGALPPLNPTSAG
jgi:hypothetical protein